MVVLAIAAAFTLLLAGLLSARAHWNNPPRVDTSRANTILVQGVPVVVKVNCQCPEYLLQSVPQEINFTINAALASAQNPPSLPPSSPSNSADGPARQQAPAALFVWLTVDGQQVRFTDGFESEALADVSSLRAGLTSQKQLRVVAIGKGSSAEVSFHVATTIPGNPNELGPDLGIVSVEMNLRPTFVAVIRPYLFYLVVLLLVAGAVYLVDRRVRSANARRERIIDQARELAEKNPEHSKYAWQLARTRLEAYFDKNLFQVNLVFWLSVVVMTAGFVVVLWGITQAANSRTVQTPGTISASEIATIAGVITQFLGATFMVIYRSTMTQANDFMNVLDRINNVGMAVQVLDQIPDQPPELKNEVRAKIIDHLLEARRADGS
jgi:nitrate reductase gamma subunit